MKKGDEEKDRRIGGKDIKRMTKGNKEIEKSERETNAYIRKERCKQREREGKTHMQKRKSERDIRKERHIQKEREGQREKERDNRERKQKSNFKSQREKVILFVSQKHF